jgi:hypothetical protein
MREELQLMEARLVARIEGCDDGLVRRMVNSEQRAARFDIDFDDSPVFDSYSDDHGGGPVFNSYPDDLDGGPNFDEDPFVDPVGDAAHDSDNAARTVLNFTPSACAIRDQEPDDLAVSLVFDTNPTASKMDPCSTPTSSTVSTRNSPPMSTSTPLFDEEHKYEEAELILYQFVVIGANIVTPADIIDAPSTCSRKFCTSMKPGRRL